MRLGISVTSRMLPKDLRTLRRPLNVVAIPALTFLSMSRRQISKDPTISRRNSGNLPSQMDCASEVGVNPAMARFDAMLPLTVSAPALCRVGGRPLQRGREMGAAPLAPPLKLLCYLSSTLAP